MKIDELARLAKTTVRNVRAYQDRGLVPKPIRKGRTGIYSDVHLARLRLINQLLARGYSLGNIAELLGAWQSGRDLEEILGLEAAVALPFVQETPGKVTAAQLATMFGADPASLRAALDLGLVERDGAKFRVPSPRTLAAGAELVAAGIPVALALETLRRVRGDVEGIAKRLVALVVEQLLGGRRSRGLPKAMDVQKLAATVWKIRPLAERVVDAELARALELAARDQLGARLDRVLDAL